jgi:hypothetical protein
MASLHPHSPLGTFPSVSVSAAARHNIPSISFKHFSSTSDPEDPAAWRCTVNPHPFFLFPHLLCFQAQKSRGWRARRTSGQPHATKGWRIAFPSYSLQRPPCLFLAWVLGLVLGFRQDHRFSSQEDKKTWSLLLFPFLFFLIILISLVYIFLFLSLQLLNCGLSLGVPSLPTGFVLATHGTRFVSRCRPWDLTSCGDSENIGIAGKGVPERRCCPRSYLPSPVRSNHATKCAVRGAPAARGACCRIPTWTDGDAHREP